MSAVMIVCLLSVQLRHGSPNELVLSELDGGLLRLDLGHRAREVSGSKAHSSCRNHPQHDDDVEPACLNCRIGFFEAPCLFDVDAQDRQSTKPVIE